MRQKKWRTGLICAAMVVVTMTGVALAVSQQGSQNDPLVTLSYLNDVVVPDLMAQAEAHIEAGTNYLVEEVRAGGKAVFSAAEIEAGSKVVLTSGTQIILRTGAAVNTDGIIDLTTGGSMWNDLETNHLYISTMDGQTISVSENAVFLIQGKYEVQTGEETPS